MVVRYLEPSRTPNHEDHPYLRESGGLEIKLHLTFLGRGDLIEKLKLLIRDAYNWEYTGEQTHDEGNYNEDDNHEENDFRLTYLCDLCSVLPRLDRAIRSSDHPTTTYIHVRSSSTAKCSYLEGSSP